MVEAAPYEAIVIPASGKELTVQLRGQDLSWNDFLSSVCDLPR